MSPQEGLHESSVLHLQAQLIFDLHSFIFLLPVTNQTQAIFLPGGAKQAGTGTGPVLVAVVTPGVALLPLAHDTGSRDGPARLSLGLCCSGDRAQTHMFKLFYVRNS